MRPTNEQVLDAYDLAIVAVDGVIRLAEADQRTNSMSRVSDVTIKWMYRCRDAIDALRKHEEERP